MAPAATAEPSGGSKSRYTTAEPAAIRSKRPPTPASLPSNVRGEGRSKSAPGTSTQATRVAKRTSSRYGCG